MSLSNNFKKVELNKYNMANLMKQFRDKNGYIVFNNNDSIGISITDADSNLFTIHKVSYTESYQVISYMYYGTTRLWWLIAKLNDVTDATILPMHGSTLKILNPSLVESVLSQLKN
jgi:hypothetical protein